MTLVFASILVNGATSAYAGNGCLNNEINGIDPQLHIIDSIIFENPNEVSAKINVCDPVTLTGAKGTGILTSDGEGGFGTLAISTTHGGVWDSLAQQLDNPADPKASAIQHNHYVDLVQPTGQCLTDEAFAQVGSISFENPGIAMWPENMYKIWEVPKHSPPGTTDFLTGQEHEYWLGEFIDIPDPINGDYFTVSFSLSVPFFSDEDQGIPGQVCVFVEDANAAQLEDLLKVGGLPIAIDSNTLILAGIQSTAMWMLPVVAVAAGAGAYFIKTRMNKD